MSRRRTLTDGWRGGNAAGLDRRLERRQSGSRMRRGGGGAVREREKGYPHGSAEEPDRVRVCVWGGWRSLCSPPTRSLR